MIALQQKSYGEPTDVLSLTDVAVPEPGPGQVRLRVLRSPIHNHDLATIRGQYGIKPELPAIGGSEVLGIVDVVGEGVASVKRGARVGTLTQGAWAEYAVAPAAAVTPMPDGISDDHAAQLLAMPLSAVVLFDSLRVKPGDWIVQNAANGAVGTILAHIAQSRGVNIINLVRRDEAANDLRAAGAQHIVVTDRDSWRSEVAEITKGAPIIRAIDSIGGTQAMDLQRLLGPSGELIIFGSLSGDALKLDPGAMIFRGLVVRGFWLAAWMQHASTVARADAANRVFELALKGELPLAVADVFPFVQAREAIKLAETPGRGGKVLLCPR